MVTTPSTIPSCGPPVNTPSGSCGGPRLPVGSNPPMVRGPTAVGRVALVAGVALLTTAAVVFTLDQAPSDARTLAAVVSGLDVAVPMLVALAVLGDDPGNRFSR